MSKVKVKSFKALQRENDEALLNFWRRVDRVRECKRALYATQENVLLCIAESERDKAEETMTVARMAFLKARLKRAKEEPHAG